MALNLWTKVTFPKCKILLTNFQQIRTTYVVERVTPARLVKAHKQPSLRAAHYVYRTLEDNLTKPQKMLTIVLIKYVEDLGQAGEIVTVKEQTGRLLIMTHKAAYPSKENVKKYATSASEQKSYSSKYAATTANLLAKFVLSISMNKENAWTLEPWHVTCSFRKAGVIVPESAITMPEQVISGPDMALEGKEFYITVTINGQEQVMVRARIHHWATNIAERLTPVRLHWRFPVDTIFAEDKEITKTLPEMVPPVLDEDETAEYDRKLMARKRQR